MEKLPLSPAPLLVPPGPSGTGSQQAVWTVAGVSAGCPGQADDRGGRTCVCPRHWPPRGPGACEGFISLLSKMGLARCLLPGVVVALHTWLVAGSRRLCRY